MICGSCRGYEMIKKGFEMKKICYMDVFAVLALGLMSVLFFYENAFIVL